ncbi:phage major tail protein, phi13 family [Virgibacillus subterraneus]|uniref:Phage major tail protein, phi13 family n=1 Tax=Virgibacillus subterraneus TaxID=621109 RepID=A0A1H9EF77_9BACI|nr:major tail protein [Virgibacillus subterraneus]SEQ23668.1 phage major tail protein, phi13 family [Virgibacillus subterraneus]
MDENKSLKLDLQFFAGEEKNYKASTGVDEFYHGVLDETTEAIIAGALERVEFAQTITVELPQEAVRAYGDNKTAEIAVANGNVSVTGAFHKLPVEVRQTLLGLETVEGLSSYGAGDNPPYVACVFAKTHEDGSKEWVGLTKGIFMRPTINAQTKQDTTTFSPDEISGQFMEREVAGFTKEKTVIFGYDEAGSTANRDALFQKVFGVAYPGSTTTTTSSSTTTTTTSA